MGNPDFRLSQNLKMSPSAQIKNLVPENLTDIPKKDEWKLGRIWFNTTIGKLQGVFLKLDRDTGQPVQPEEMEIRVIGGDLLGETRDGNYWPDGLFDFTEQTKISDAMDEVNEALKDLAPPEATLLRGELNLTGQKFLTGKVSILTNDSPNKLIMAGVNSGEELSYIVINPMIQADLPNDGLLVKGKQQQQFGKADQGIIAAFVDGVRVDDGIDLKTVFYNKGRDFADVFQGFDYPIEQIITDIEGKEISVLVNPNKDKFKSVTGALTIGKVERYNDFKKWQRGSGYLNITVTPGNHDIWVEHDGISSGAIMNAEIKTDPFKTNILKVFYDPSKTIPTSTTTNATVSSSQVKYISGIPFHNKDIKITFNYQAKNIFDYTYWDKPISIKITGCDHDLVEWNSKDSNLKNVLVPKWNDTFDLVNYVVDYSAKASIVDSLTITTKSGKPAYGWSKDENKTLTVLIDNTGLYGNSNSIKETFIDEEYRIDSVAINSDNLKSVLDYKLGIWDSTKKLKDDQAQQYMGSLIKAQSDFKKFNILVDYTTHANTEQTYCRRIYRDGKSNSNGILKVDVKGEVGLDFDIFIKFPSITAWLNLNEMFDVEVFAENYLTNGMGCATKITKTKTGYNFDWTIGTFSTFDSGFGYLVKIVIKTSSVKITGIEEISDNWRL